MEDAKWYRIMWGRVYEFKTLGAYGIAVPLKVTKLKNQGALK